jgi:membrane-bound lytic murein transglycosylase A
MTHMHDTRCVESSSLTQSCLLRHLSATLVAGILGACSTLNTTTEPSRPVKAAQPAPEAATAIPSESGAATAIPAEPAAAQPAPKTAPPATSALPGNLVPASWSELPKWTDDDHASALKVFVQSCRLLDSREAWRTPCEAAARAVSNRSATARHFFETYFAPFHARLADGRDEGLITGYYEPLLKGSRRQTERFRFPVYGVPDDLVSIELGDMYPELKGLRLRGRIEGRRVVPYFTRAQIDAGKAFSGGSVLFWVDDPIDLFFLQVQGSGQIDLGRGVRARVGFADQNGHPYRSIGRLLIERGELTAEQATMQGIKAWARRNPEQLADVLAHNARYVFFREIDGKSPGPLGALGVPLTAGRSLAVDPSFIPLGAPVYLATTAPNSKQPLRRLMFAQDTGSAIRGEVRADYFWGFGEQAGSQAGRMRQPGRMWVLLPKQVSPESLLGH